MELSNFRLIFLPLSLIVILILCIKWTLRGENYLAQNKSFIIIANHQSCLDVLGLFNIWSIIGRLTGIAKKELLFFFPGLYLAGTIFIDRHSPKGKEVINEAMDRLKKVNAKLLVFPEGTRRNTGEIHPFKKGAFYAAIHHQVPIVPVVISSYLHFVDHEKKMFDEGEMIIRALPQISTTGVTAKEINDFMERIRQQMIKVYEETSAEAAKN
ncbi:hypothetical protein ACKWTF_005079 [Chironomus riparius]